MFKLISICIVAALLVGPLLASSDKQTDLKRARELRELMDLQTRDSIYDDELFNRLFPYQTSGGATRSRNSNNVIKPNEPYGESRSEVVEIPDTSKAEASPDQSDDENTAKVAHSSPGGERPSFMKDVKDLDKAKSLAYNSREVRIVGPEQREVEMKDDLPTKLAAVLDNLRIEATDLFGQVNKGLDKGWTEFKQSVDKIVEEGKKQVSKL